MIDQSVGGGTPSIRDDSVVAEQAAGRGARAVGRAGGAIRTGSTFHLAFFLCCLAAFVRSRSVMSSPGFGWFVDRHLEREAIVRDGVRYEVRTGTLFVYG